MPLVARARHAALRSCLRHAALLLAAIAALLVAPRGASADPNAGPPGNNDRAAYVVEATVPAKIRGLVGGMRIEVPLRDVTDVQPHDVVQHGPRSWTGSATVTLIDGTTLELSKAELMVQGGNLATPDAEGWVHAVMTTPGVDTLVRFLQLVDPTARLVPRVRPNRTPIDPTAGGTPIPSMSGTNDGQGQGVAVVPTPPAPEVAGSQPPASTPPGASASPAIAEALARVLRSVTGNAIEPAEADRLAKTLAGQLVELERAAQTIGLAKRSRRPGNAAARRAALVAARADLIDVLERAARGDGHFSPERLQAEPDAARAALDAAVAAFHAAGGRTAALRASDRATAQRIARVYRNLAEWRRVTRGAGPLHDVPAIVGMFIKRDITQDVVDGKVPAIVGRSREIRQGARGLSTPGKSNVVYIGEPGVGKTAVVEGLAQAIVQGDVPEQIQQKRVVELSMAKLTAGTKYRGEFEERMIAVLEAIVALPRELRPILFIDEVHTVIGAGAAEGAVDASQILKPYLDRGELQIAAATTLAEYERLFKKDAALDRRFKPVRVDEPTPQRALTMVASRTPRIEKHFGNKIRVRRSAQRAAVELSVRYLVNRQLPDKAHDVLEEAATRVAEQGRREVTDADVKAVVAEWSGVPIRTGKDEARGLLALEAELGERVYGQDDAIRMTADGIRRQRAQMMRRGSRQPTSFIYAGPTGVGKTELAKGVARALFGDEDAAVVIDMAEFKESHSIANLKGAPNGYVNSDEGGRLTNAVRDRPFVVVLLDEIEKATPDVFDLLLGVLEEGRLSDRKGPVDFRNVILIGTTNLLKKKPAAKQQLGFGQRDEVEDGGDRATRDALIAAGLKPEFVNRVGGVVVFNDLEGDNLDRVVRKTVAEVGRMYDVELDADGDAVAAIRKAGMHPELGARPMRRAVRDRVEGQLAVEVLRGATDRRYTVRHTKDGVFKVSPVKSTAAELNKGLARRARQRAAGRAGR